MRLVTVLNPLAKHLNMRRAARIGKLWESKLHIRLEDVRCFYKHYWPPRPV